MESGQLESKYEKYMKEALAEAEKAYSLGEAPIGAVVEYKGEIIGRGCNKRNSEKNPLAHAELIAIKQAADYIKDWRLEGCNIYITLEPCPMCAGAIVQARIDKAIIGTMNPKAGSAGSIVNLLQTEGYNHRVEIVNGIREEECRGMLKRFFKELRDGKVKE